jgi:hypothetical protein
VIPPQLETILAGVEATQTPDQVAYLESLVGDEDTQAVIDAKTEAYFTRLLAEQNGDVLFVEEPAFTGDSDRIVQALKGLPFQAGLPTPGPLVAGEISEESSQSQLLPLQANPACDERCLIIARRQALRRYQQERRRCIIHQRECLRMANDRRISVSDRMRLRRLCSLEARNCAREVQLEFRRNVELARGHCGCHNQGGGG